MGPLMIPADYLPLAPEYMNDIFCQKYEPKHELQWDKFIDNSKNAPFFFKRKFMEYHADRFFDNSVIVYSKNKIMCVFPACATNMNEIIVSHAGLTFGGLVIDQNMTTPIFLKCFSSLLNFLHKESAMKLIYKSIPNFYHQIAASEEQYAAFRFGGRLIRRDIGSIINPKRKPEYSNLRNRMINKGIKTGLSVRESNDYTGYWQILINVLKTKHGVNPVHSLSEIQYLHSIFKDNIKLFGAFKGSKMLAGVVIFNSRTVAHAQYIASSDEGRECGALDLIFDHLITDIYANKDCFSFGISTEQDGTILNEGLINQKEGFGARATVFDTYEFDLSAPQSGLLINNISSK